MPLYGVVTTDEERQALGVKIKAARLTAGLSLDALGERVGTTRQHLIRLEQGQHAPTAKLLRRIARETSHPTLLDWIARTP